MKGIMKKQMLIFTIFSVVSCMQASDVQGGVDVSARHQVVLQQFADYLVRIPDGRCHAEVENTGVMVLTCMFAFMGLTPCACVQACCCGVAGGCCMSSVQLGAHAWNIKHLLKELYHLEPENVESFLDSPTRKAVSNRDRKILEWFQTTLQARKCAQRYYSVPQILKKME
jgi:hypothetical protein